CHLSDTPAQARLSPIRQIITRSLISARGFADSSRVVRLVEGAPGEHRVGGSSAQSRRRAGRHLFPPPSAPTPSDAAPVPRIPLACSRVAPQRCESCVGVESGALVSTP